MNKPSSGLKIIPFGKRRIKIEIRGNLLLISFVGGLVYGGTIIEWLFIVSLNYFGIPCLPVIPPAGRKKGHVHCPALHL